MGTFSIQVLFKAVFCLFFAFLLVVKLSSYSELQDLQKKYSLDVGRKLLLVLSIN